MSNNQPTISSLQAHPALDGVVIRMARGDDALAVARLAALDSQAAPQGALLLAESGDELWAALPLDGGHPVADPFRPTAGVVELLRLRAAQLRRTAAAYPQPRRVPRFLAVLGARARA